MYATSRSILTPGGNCGLSSANVVKEQQAVMKPGTITRQHELKNERRLQTILREDIDKTPWLNVGWFELETGSVLNADLSWYEI
jgi:hypothetical protein